MRGLGRARCSLGLYADRPITDIPTYEAAWRHIADGDVPYRDFPLEYPPLAAGLFWLAGVLPGHYDVAFSALMCVCLSRRCWGSWPWPAPWAWTSGARPSPASPSP